MRVVEITTEQTHPLRLAVLRAHSPTTDVTFPEDAWPDTMHLGVLDATGLLVATSSWVQRDCAEHPGERGVQLRGMATAHALQGTGIGGLLLEAGIERHRDLGFDVIWARARDSALDFYLRHGCTVVGDGFIDDTTQLPHHVVVRRLRR